MDSLQSSLVNFIQELIRIEFSDIGRTDKLEIHKRGGTRPLDEIKPPRYGAA